MRAPDDRHIAAALQKIEPLFSAIGRASFDGVGFTRPAYGPGEQAAHNTVAAVAHELRLAIDVDPALNMTMTLSGENGAPAVVLGSHLDSVPRGGNFDGLAGVLAGLAVVTAWRESGIAPPRDIAVMAIRAEESAWFGAQHIGSRARLGSLPAATLTAARRVDTGRTLGDHMAEAGVDISSIAEGRRLQDPKEIAAYIEVHIEQGPVLLERGVPLGIVTGIRGNRRAAQAACVGAYGHSGTVPRNLRHDAVFAVAELVGEMDRLWSEVEVEGGDLVLTFGKFSTDPEAHAVTTVPGKVAFSYDIRSHDSATLDRVETALHQAAARIGERRALEFKFGPSTSDLPATMDPDLQSLLAAGAAELAIPALPIASGAGHDAGDFAEAGVRSAMIFLRNDKGSHNPDEAMELSDFAAGVRLLVWATANIEKVL